MEWRPARLSVCPPLLIFPCTIKSRSSLLAPAHPGGPGKRAVERFVCVCVTVCDDNDVIQVSKPLSVTRSAYLFIIIDGQLSAYSLITGQKLLRLDYSNSLLSDGKRSLSL